nr:Stp1/IreP family PP2C-type Ser/Thr phosphatase [uncultured Bacillus sp.]
MKMIFMTDKGKVRQHNEDCGGILINPSGQFLAVVADGMGGHRAGDVASDMTVTELKRLWEAAPEIVTADQAESWLKTSINEVNAVLHEHASSHSECDGMGTTIVAVIITQLFLTVAHIGDSRCYILNEAGFSQITEDHSLVNELVRSGEITKEDAENHPRKNVLIRALGTEKTVEMDIRSMVFEEGDLLLLCSDGLSNKVNESEIVECLQQEILIDEKASRLIQLANSHGGEDNISLVIVEYEREASQGDVQ